MKTRNFQLITALEKNLLKISTIFKSSLTISSLMLPSVCLFYQCCFSDNLILPERKGFTVRQNCLLSVRSFSFKFAQQLVFVFHKRDTQQFFCFLNSCLLLSEQFLIYIILKQFLVIKAFFIVIFIKGILFPLE